MDIVTEPLAQLTTARESIPIAPILEVQDLRTYFYTRAGIGKAVDGISFELRAGETVGLVGESGSGKSMTALSILQLHPQPASRIVGGKVLFKGEDLLRKTPAEMRNVRGRHIGLILQDPQTALNPVLTVGEQIYESLRLHLHLHGAALRDRAVELLRLLRVPDAARRLGDYPHQFSGGMRQRVVGAIALAAQPEVLIADEPTTSLDVTVQAAYLELLKDVQRQTNIAILFITHDLNVVARLCDRTVVMYAGKVVEAATTRSLFSNPTHPYSEALLKSVLSVDKVPRRLYSIQGQPPSIYGSEVGCRFAARCPYAMERCAESPPLISTEAGHEVACWLRVN